MWFFNPHYIALTFFPLFFFRWIKPLWTSLNFFVCWRNMPWPWTLKQTTLTSDDATFFRWRLVVPLIATEPNPSVPERTTSSWRCSPFDRLTRSCVSFFFQILSRAYGMKMHGICMEYIKSQYFNTKIGVAICARSPVQILFTCHLCVWNLK